VLNLDEGCSMYHCWGIDSYTHGLGTHSAPQSTVEGSCTTTGSIVERLWTFENYHLFITVHSWLLGKHGMFWLHETFIKTKLFTWFSSPSKLCITYRFHFTFQSKKNKVFSFQFLCEGVIKRWSVLIAHRFLLYCKGNKNETNLYCYLKSLWP
jgi:hypothetical protein